MPRSWHRAAGSPQCHLRPRKGLMEACAPPRAPANGLMEACAPSNPSSALMLTGSAGLREQLGRRARPRSPRPAPSCARPLSWLTRDRQPRRTAPEHRYRLADWPPSTLVRQAGPQFRSCGAACQQLHCRTRAVRAVDWGGSGWVSVGTDAPERGDWPHPGAEGVRVGEGLRDVALAVLDRFGYRSAVGQCRGDRRGQGVPATVGVRGG
jgi:hypothetical protein